MRGAERNSIPLHWDKDECEAMKGGVNPRMTHPALASVLYLTDEGGPTLVLPLSTVRMEEWRDAAAQDAVSTATGKTSGLSKVGAAVKGEAYASYPTTNRWLTFQGDLLHGVAPLAYPARRHHALTEPCVQNKRVTLLVNWWWAKPLGPCCERQSDADAAAAKTAAAETAAAETVAAEMMDTGSKVKSATVTIASVVGACGEEAASAAAAGCGYETLRLQLPGLLGGGILPLSCPVPKNETNSNSNSIEKEDGACRSNFLRWDVRFKH
jgi:hypothetical protein